MLDEDHLRAIIHPLDRDRQIVRKSVDFVRSANTDAILPASLTARLNEDQIERLNALKVRYQEKKRNTINRPRLEKGPCQATHIFVNFKTRNRIPQQSCREEILHSPTRSLHHQRPHPIGYPLYGLYRQGAEGLNRKLC